MKPSEFITKFKASREKNNIVLRPMTFEDLDSRFIDREELKDKINKKIKEKIDNNIVNFEILTKKEILEMLK